MNGFSEDMSIEPGDDEGFAIACGYEIITQDELYEMFDISYGRRFSIQSSSHAGAPMGFGLLKGNGKPLVSKPSVASFISTSTQSSGVSSMMSKPSSCSLSSQASHITEFEDDCFSIADLNDVENHEEMDHDYQMSVEQIWSKIQQKGHYHDDLDEGLRMDDHHIWTLEHTSNGKKLTAWFHNLLHFPEKIRQISANRQRFNVNKVPEEIRDELKHIYVY